MLKSVAGAKKWFGAGKGAKLSPPIKDLLLGISVGAVIVLFSLFGVFQKFEYLSLDNMFRLRGERHANEDIAIVGIDDKSLEVLGRWPWPRDYHASFLQILNLYDPKFIVFDILFPEADPAGDIAMAVVAEEKNNVYLASYFTLDKKAEAIPAIPKPELPSPPQLNYKIKNKDRFLYASDITLPVRPLLKTARSAGIVNSPPDADGATRHLPLAVEYGGKLYPTLSLQLACDYLGVDIDSMIINPRHVILPLQGDDIRIPVDSQGGMLLNFSGPIDTFERYSYIQLLHDYNRSLKEGTKSILENLKGKVVFIGHTATGSVDSRIMPFSNFYPAVGMHATALGNILDRDLITEAPAGLNVLAILSVGILLSLVIKKGKKFFVNLAMMLVLFLAYSVLGFILFAVFNFRIYTFAPLLTVLLTYVTVSINHYEAVQYEKRLLENELLIARNIQESFLPKKYPEIPRLEFAARCNPAKHVGGDLYDFVALEDGGTGVIIGDVSGKGIPAALYMARAISEFRTASRTHRDAAATLKALNETFAKEGMVKSFITMQYLTLDADSKRFILSNGGHNTVLHYKKAENNIEEVNSEEGMAIGLMEGIDFDNKEVCLNKGDVVFLYTDGISEAMNKQHREFGMDRVKETLRNNSDLKSEDIISKVFDEIAKYSKGAPQHDDMTAIAIKAV